MRLAAAEARREWETYCLTPTGMASSVTRGYNDDVRQIFPTNAFDAENLQYAVRLQRTLLEVNGTTGRGVRRARFHTVLRSQNRPGGIARRRLPVESQRIEVDRHDSGPSAEIGGSGGESFDRGEANRKSEGFTPEAR